jgi:hypothetical protein
VSREVCPGRPYGVRRLCTVWVHQHAGRSTSLASGWGTHTTSTILVSTLASSVVIPVDVRMGPGLTASAR